MDLPLLAAAALMTLGGPILVAVLTHHLARKLGQGVWLVGVSLAVLYGALLWLRPTSWWTIDLAVVAGAIGGALLLQATMRSRIAVATFVVTAAAVDLLSVSGGLTKAVVDSYRAGGSDLLLYLTLVAPSEGSVRPIIGVGDLLVGGAAGAALLRTTESPARVLCALAAGLGTALAVGLWRGGVAALPFIAVACLLALSRSRRTDNDGESSRSTPEKPA